MGDYDFICDDARGEAFELGRDGNLDLPPNGPLDAARFLAAYFEVDESELQAASVEQLARWLEEHAGTLVIRNTFDDDMSPYRTTGSLAPKWPERRLSPPLPRDS